MTNKQWYLFDVALATNSMTDDPYVNWRVDNHNTADKPPYNEEMEVAAIKAWLESGGFLLSVK